MRSPPSLSGRDLRPLCSSLLQPHDTVVVAAAARSPPLVVLVG
jgi:hypothetical protein